MKYKFKIYINNFIQKKMENYEKILNSLNIPLIPEENIILTNHKIFQKYTSKLYYKYSYDLLDTLTKKTNYENKKRLLHTSFIYLTYILYNCGNIPYLSNFDLMIFCCFYLGVKVIIKQNKVPGLTKFKKIYSEKYSDYKNEEIVKAEIICIKLLKYKINFLTVYDCLYYLLYNNKNLFNLALNKFENEKVLNINEYINKKPLDFAKEIIHSLDIKVKIKYPKILQKKIIQNSSNININKFKYQNNTNRLHIPNNNDKMNNNNSTTIQYNKFSTLINLNKSKVVSIFSGPGTEKHDSIYKKHYSKKSTNKTSLLNSSKLVNSFSNMDIELNSSPFNNTNCSSSPAGSDGLSSFVIHNNSGVKLTDNSLNGIFKKPCLDKKNMKTSFVAKHFRYTNNKSNLDLSTERIGKESNMENVVDNYLSCTFYSKKKRIKNKNNFINFQS